LDTTDQHWGYDTGDHQSVEAYFNIKNSYKCQASDFRACYWWNMYNDGTPSLNWDTYAQSFSDVAPDESHYIHPLNWLYYEAL